MSGTDTRLTGQQADQIKKWLIDKGLMRCKACNFDNLAQPTVIISLAGERMPSEHNVFMVPVSCGYCGNTLLINAKTAGLMD
jgi:hypothetical protein